jgi:hypothetical protein
MLHWRAMSTGEFVLALRRNASVLDRSKALYWRNYKRTHGEAEGIRIADELRRQVASQRTNWPSPREREEDHAAHLRVLDALERVASRGR